MDKYKAIVILGGGRYKDGSLTELSLQRLRAGARIYNLDKCYVLALGGNKSNYRADALRFDTTGAEVRASVLAKLGIETADIIKVAQGGDTITEAFVTRRKVRELSIRHIDLVTSAIHMPRALFIFERILGVSTTISPISVPSDHLLDPAEEDEYLNAVKEFFASQPENIPDPDIETWFINNQALYWAFDRIRKRYAEKEAYVEFVSPILR